MGKRLRSLMLTVRRGPVIYPFLFAVYPILFIWAHNVGEFTQSAEQLEIFVPLAISIGFTLVALVSIGFILGDTRKAGLLVLWFLIAFYSYGHVYTSLQNADFGDSSSQGLFFLAWWSGFLAVFILLIRVELQGLTNTLNAVSGFLVIIPLVIIGAFTLGSVSNFLDRGDKKGGTSLVDASITSSPPDIYYIIPDYYAGSQTLRDLGYDNGDFTDFLTNKGFFVASRSRSNYMYTKVSLASSLNMQYLTGIEGALPGTKWATVLYHNLINKGQVIGTLKSLGYTIINTREKWTLRRGSHEPLICARDSLIRLQADDFTGAVLNTTALYPVLRYFNVLERQIWDQRLCEFSMIVDVKDIEGPKFVFAHLSVPHPPFIFDRDGPRDPVSLGTINTFVNRPEEYIDQVVFVNKKLREIVNSLLSGTGNPPVIIIQADHGPINGSDSFTTFHPIRFDILNAYYLPNGGNDLLYESISPVNSFRVIFNSYFGANYEILEDRSYQTSPRFAGSTHDDVTDLITKYYLP